MQLSECSSRKQRVYCECTPAEWNRYRKSLNALKNGCSKALDAGRDATQVTIFSGCSIQRRWPTPALDSADARSSSEDALSADSTILCMSSALVQYAIVSTWSRCAQIAAVVAWHACAMSAPAGHLRSFLTTTYCTSVVSSCSAMLTVRKSKLVAYFARFYSAPGLFGARVEVQQR